MKRVVVILFVLLWVSGLATPTFAMESDLETADTYLEALYDELPEEIKPYIEKEYTSENLTLQGLLTVSEGFIKNCVKVFLKILSELLVVILFAAVVKKMKDAFSKHSFSDLISCTILITYLAVRLFALAKETDAYCRKIQSFMSIVALSLGSISALGGNMIFASSMTATVSGVSVLLESACLVLLMPIVKLSLVSMMTSYQGKSGLSSLGRMSRSFFQWIIGFLCFFSVTVFTYQSVIAQAEDTLSARTLRYAVNGSVPFVGGALGDSLRTLTASVNIMRQSVGTLGVISVLVLALFPLTSLISYKFAIAVMEEVSLTLGLENEKWLLCEAKKLLNMLIAVIILVSLLYIFSLSVYMLIPLANQ